MNTGDTIKHKQSDKEFTIEKITNTCVTLKDGNGQLHYITPKGISNFEIIKIADVQT